MSKLFYIFGLVAALFLQGCASSALRSAGTDDGFWSRPNFACAQGCRRNEAAAIYWDTFSKEYKVLRNRGERLSPQGRMLTPVPGKPGQFQDENGYRVVHQMTCNKENAALTFFGALLTIGGSQLPNVGARVATVGLTGATQTSLGRARSYKCAELAEELNAGNVIFQQRMNEQMVAQNTEQSNSYAVEQDVQPLRDVAQAPLVAQQSNQVVWCAGKFSESYPDLFRGMTTEQVIGDMGRRCQEKGQQFVIQDCGCG